MLLLNIYAVISFSIIGINAYPTIYIPHLFGTIVDGREKKSDLKLSQTDADVIELEHLRRKHPSGITEELLPDNQPNFQHSPAIIKDDITKSIEAENLPELERELELATPKISTTQAPLTITEGNKPKQSEKDIVEHGVHKPPVLPHNDGGKTQVNQGAVIDVGEESGIAATPPMSKPFYGAARLAFGQNPEVILTSSSTTTTTTTTALPTSNNDKNQTSSEFLANGSSDKEQMIETGEDIDENTKESAVSDVPIELKSVAARRSMPLMSPKIAQNLLKHGEGQYSSFDMAQYVFWTGDEAGVAHAVEELIEQDLMSRENALTFLRDIRLGIEYLQRSYANRVFPEEIRQNSVKKNHIPPTQPTTSTTTTTTTTTTNKPISYVQPETTVQQPQNNPYLRKTLDNAALWNKLQDLNIDRKQDLSDYDESSGRAKIAEYLYTEYTLEEILYKLAKVMFTQSLAHGSDEAQQELQKLTDFLEREGNLGVIPIDLQKKVLRVLLTALSDTLNEHPELLPAARSNLASPFNRTPIRVYGTVN